MKYLILNRWLPRLCLALCVVLMVAGIKVTFQRMGLVDSIVSILEYLVLYVVIQGINEYRIWPLLKGQPPMSPFGFIDTDKLAVVLSVNSVEQGVDYLVSKVPYLPKKVDYKSSEATLQLGDWSEMNLMKFKIKVLDGSVVVLPVLSFWKGDAEGTLMFLHHLGQPLQEAYT